MENLINNKKTAEVFSRYVELRHRQKYKVVLPTNPNDSEFDAKLDLEGHESLLLQLKQLIIFESSENRFTKSKLKIFRINLIESVVKKAENKYKDKAKNLILILHVDEGYLISSDSELIKRNNFTNSTFKGIYMVSPEHKLWSADGGKKIQNEFVSEIKNAFS
jgi:hypothetical protein